MVGAWPALPVAIKKGGGGGKLATRKSSGDIIPALKHKQSRV